MRNCLGEGSKSQRARRGGGTHIQNLQQYQQKEELSGISICALTNLRDIPVDSTNSSWEHKSKVQGRTK